MQTIEIFDPAKGRYVNTGDYSDKDRTYCRAVCAHQIMRMFGGSIGIQYEIIQKLNRLGCLNVVIVNENGTRYSSELEQWVSSGLVRDFGHGKQVFVRLRDMTIKED